MKILQENQTDEAVEILKKSEILAFPTDTVIGIGCDAFNESAVNKIFEVKKRPKNKPLIVLISNFDQLKILAKYDSEAKEFIEKFWPGPVTLIFNKAKTAPNWLGSEDSIAIRFPKKCYARDLMEKLDKPVTSTSFNVSGEKIPTEKGGFLRVQQELSIDLVLPDNYVPGKPSKIFDIRYKKFLR